jgi:hypothetical protein
VRQAFQQHFPYAAFSVLLYPGVDHRQALIPYLEQAGVPTWRGVLMHFGDVYRGTTVLVTGHTGFKGAWLSEWLLGLGAQVVGYALAPPTTPALFSVLQLETRLAADCRGDVRSLPTLEALLRRYAPAVIFHLAAQPLVRRAFEAPYEAYFQDTCKKVPQRPHVVIAKSRWGSIGSGCTVISSIYCPNRLRCSVK